MIIQGIPYQLTTFGIIVIVLICFGVFLGVILTDYVYKLKQKQLKEGDDN